MSNYNQILKAFKEQGYSQTTALQEYEINRALDQISGSRGGPRQFDRDVAQQLWDHTPKERGNTVLVRDYAQSIIQAQNVLKEHIAATQQKLKYVTSPDEKEELQADLLSYVNDHKLLTQPFNIEHVQSSRMIEESRRSMAASNKLSAYEPAGGDGGWARTSQIFTMKPSQHQESWSLKIVFVLTVILMGIELFVLFHKHHFFNLIGFTLIMLIFVQNFFDKLYMRITITWVFLSILLDFLWLIVHAENWWNPYPETQHSTIQTGYLRFSYFLVICTMLAKVLVFILTIRYFNNSEDIRKSVSLFKLSFKLDGRSNNNPLTQILKGNSNASEPIYNYE